MSFGQRDFSTELNFKAVRSQGAGGQNVNKVSSKVVLSFDIDASQILSDEEKSILKTKAVGKINSEGILQIASQTSRSQFQNKQEVIKKFYALLQKAFTPGKVRVKTKPSQASVQKRLLTKKKKSEKKAIRSNKNFTKDLD